MKLEYYEDLPDNLRDHMWDQGVDMDDWDYLIITREVDAFEEVEETDVEWSSETKKLETIKVKVLQPKEWTLSRLLTGCYRNTWKKIKWKNKEAVVGVAYHS